VSGETQTTAPAPEGKTVRRAKPTQLPKPSGAKAAAAGAFAEWEAVFEMSCLRPELAAAAARKRLHDEAPAALAEIFADADADDGRNRVLYEFCVADGFRKSRKAIGTAGNAYDMLYPYDLLDSVLTCIRLHLTPRRRLAEDRRQWRVIAKRLHAAAMALEELSRELPPSAPFGGWEEIGLSNPTDRRTIEKLRNMAAELDGALNLKVAKVSTGTRMAAFAHLIKSLAIIYTRVTKRPAALTYDDPSGAYKGDFWNLVEIVRPIAAGIIAKGGGQPLAEPEGDGARAMFIIRTTGQKGRRKRKGQNLRR
jgi:hypothetical protein